MWNLQGFNLKYRAEIDGLRALAVVPVILFHAGFELFSGGFVGVDVFFVISGYLITTILIEDIENKRFSIVNFYERRARRILPALFFVMLICIPFAWMWMLPNQMKDFSQSLVAVSLFASNILFWRESGYFAAAAEEKPLLHTWSLAVEEQYYVLFPIFLILAWRFGKNRVLWMIVVMAAISLLLSEWGWRREATANFYLTPTRAWEIFSGSISAFVIHKYGIQKNNLLALLGFAAIICSIFIFDKNTPFPSLYTLLPVIGSVLIVLYADKETIVAKVLSLKLVVGFGLISYSTYLWHQPLFAFLRISTPTYPSAWAFALMSIMSVGFGYLSWKYIESPFRKSLTIKRTLLWRISVAFIILPIIFGAVIIHNEDIYRQAWIEKSNPTQVNALSMLEEALENQNFAFSNLNLDGTTNCQFFNLMEGVENENEIIGSLQSCFEKYGEGIILLGDSHSLDVFNLLVRQKKYPFILNLRQIGCRAEENTRGCNLDMLSNLIEEAPFALSKLIFVNAGFWNLINDNNAEVRRSDFAKLADNETVEFRPNSQRISATFDYLTPYLEHFNIAWLAPRAEPHIDLRLFLKNGCESVWQYRPNQVETFNAIEKEIKEQNIKLGSTFEIKSQIRMFNFDLSVDFSDCRSLFWTDSDHFSAFGEDRFSNRLEL